MRADQLRCRCLAVTYLVCVYFDLMFTEYAIFETWAGLLPGFVWLTPGGCAIGPVESFVYGWYFAMVFDGLFSVLVAGGRPA